MIDLDSDTSMRKLSKLPGDPNDGSRKITIDAGDLSDLHQSAQNSSDEVTGNSTTSLSRRFLRKLHTANCICREFGFIAMMKHAMSSIGGRLIHFEAHAILWLQIDDIQGVPELPPEMETRFLTVREVKSFARDTTNELTLSHIRKVRAGTDLCFAVLAQGRLASYGMYATGMFFGLGDNGLVMRSPARVAHTHSGFTHPDFRGRRLHGIAKLHALQALSDRGIDTLLTDVGWANYGSLRSLTRIGYKLLGNLYSIGGGRFHFVIEPKAARLCGVAFERRGTPDGQSGES